MGSCRGIFEKALQLNPQSDAKELLAYVVQNGSLTVLNEGIDLYEKNNYQTALLKFNEVLKKKQITLTLIIIEG